MEALHPWLGEKLGLISQKTKLAEAIRYALTRWEGLSLFLDDGQVEIDNNAVERAIRPLALTRKNALFAGSDGGAEHWAVIASLIETCKLNDVDPQAYLADVITRIVNGHPQSRLDQLLPWAHLAAHQIKDVARERRLRLIDLIGLSFSGFFTRCRFPLNLRLEGCHGRDLSLKFEIAYPLSLRPIRECLFSLRLIGNGSRDRFPSRGRDTLAQLAA